MPRTRYVPVILAAIGLPAAGFALYASGNGTGGANAVTQREARAVAVRALVFRDGGAGEILVFDANADKPFVTLKRESNTFIANTVRLLATERTRRTGAGPEAPFNLTLWSDGRLSLTDPATGQAMEIEAFGHTNAQSFARLLPANARL